MIQQPFRIASIPIESIPVKSLHYKLKAETGREKESLQKFLTVVLVELQLLACEIEHDPKFLLGVAFIRQKKNLNIFLESFSSDL